MGNFDRAYSKTLGNEGEYSNHPADRGGETYRGISRKRWPLWPGWKKIDAVRQDPGFPTIIKYIPGIDQDVKDFYRFHFWEMIHGDLIPSQPVAEKLFDFAVNAGVETVVKFMQESLNVLNLKGVRWPDIEVDGKMGIATMNAIAACMRSKYEDVLLIMFSGRMVDHYYTIMCRDHNQECFAINWIRRSAKL